MCVNDLFLIFFNVWKLIRNLCIKIRVIHRCTPTYAMSATCKEFMVTTVKFHTIRNKNGNWKVLQQIYKCDLEIYKQMVAVED